MRRTYKLNLNLIHSSTTDVDFGDCWRDHGEQVVDLEKIIPKFEEFITIVDVRLACHTQWGSEYRTILVLKW